MEKLSLQDRSVLGRTNEHRGIHLLGVGEDMCGSHSDVRHWHEYYIVGNHPEAVTQCSVLPPVPNFKMLAITSACVSTSKIKP